MTLWRYILRAHAGPFVFANAIIIFLFLLQFLMKSAGDLVGKGLSVGIILELIALNLAWMVVLAVPMSVLVATLMAFGRLSADNETVIMRASGMSLYRMMFPVVIAAALVTLGLIHFNNAILPEANIRLRTLMTDIVRIKPTLTLRAGVFTSEEDIPNFRILVRRTHENSDLLEGVTIYDLSRPDKSVVVTARRGRVRFSRDYSKIFMDLEEGEIHDLTVSDMRPYRTLTFDRHRVAIPASGFGFQRSDASTAQRDDRTMSAQMMRAIVDSVARLKHAADTAFAVRATTGFAAYLEGKPLLSSPVPADSARDLATARYRARLDVMQLRTEASTRATQRLYEQELIDKYLVEIYKKYSIPVACLVFVLIGAPLGMAARRGGFGVGAGLSLGFFLFYWACLIGGEKLADRNVLSPFWGMWAANIVLGSCGVVLTFRAAREMPMPDLSALARIIPRRFRGPSATVPSDPRSLGNPGGTSADAQGRSPQPASDVCSDAGSTTSGMGGDSGSAPGIRGDDGGAASGTTSEAGSKDGREG